MTWERADPGPPNPLAWSVPLVSVLGIRFRIHFSFLLFAALVLLRATVGPPESAWLHGAKAAGMQLAALLVVVLWRELARALVVRASGGTADEVMLWPLGSLQGIDPAPGWLPALLAACVGSAAAALQLAAVGIALGTLAGDWSAALPNPMTAEWLATPHPWWMVCLWFLQWTGIQVAILSLMPMLPLDGGRVAEAIIIRRRGAFDAPRAAAAFSLFAAALAGVVAIVRDLATVMAVAIACAGFAVLQLWRLRAGDAVARSGMGGWGLQSGGFGGPSAAEPDPDQVLREDAARRREQRAAEDREVDRILEKIARDGAESLTRAEREALARATERQRGGG
jgi:Zn-dependent protease